MTYWLHWHNVRYEIDKRIEKVLLVIAMRLPARLRMWVVVDATNTARRLYPHPTGYAGPDGLGYPEIYDGALKRREHPEAPTVGEPRRSRLKAVKAESGQPESAATIVGSPNG